MAQIEIQFTGERTSPHWRVADVALRRRPGARPRLDVRSSLHEGRGLLLPMTGWAGAGHDGHLRTTPIAFR